MVAAVGLGRSDVEGRVQWDAELVRVAPEAPTQGDGKWIPGPSTHRLREDLSEERESLKGTGVLLRLRGEGCRLEPAGSSELLQSGCDKGGGAGSFTTGWPSIP